MKQIILLLFSVTSMAAYSQKANLSTVNTVKPKKGMKMAFEAAYKQHVAKFHKADNKLSVYEILSGPYLGYYHLVNSDMSYSDLDKERADATEHSLDLDKTFFPYLEITMNATYRLMDTLSLRPISETDKFSVWVRHLKTSLNMEDYRRELGRGVKIMAKLKSGFYEKLSFAFFEQIWDGTDQVTVSVRNLTDGFASLDPKYYPDAPAGTPSFRDEYAKEYGHAAWDARVKIMDGATEKLEMYNMKLRKDLSSQ